MLDKIFKIFSSILALIQMIAGVGTFSPSLSVKDKEQPYPYILVHGYAGWGFDEKLDSALPYWGSFNGDLDEYLNSNDCECYSASVGAFSSAWDRACELYAQLSGTTVDYGEAHSKKFGHNRYGKTYDKPLFEGWSENKKVNLIAHSFGGNTVRLLSTLMSKGSEEERKLTIDGSLSPLFEGGHSGWIYSITTLASPHNGTTLTDILCTGNEESLLTIVLYRLLGAMGISENIKDIYDVDFTQWNLIDESGKLSKEKINMLIETPDSGFYDLTLIGAKELNEFIETQDDIYYYSIAGSITKKSPISNNQIPIQSTGGATALLMGRYTGTALYSDIVIDESWLSSDGTVNTISALHPDDEPYKDFDNNKIESGIWQVFPVRALDHNAFTGGKDMSKESATELADSIIELINIISSTYTKLD